MKKILITVALILTIISAIYARGSLKKYSREVHVKTLMVCDTMELDLAEIVLYKFLKENSDITIIDLTQVITGSGCIYFHIWYYRKGDPNEI